MDARLHRNLVDSSARLFALDRGAAIEHESGWLFGAGRAAQPTISNAAFRADDGVAPDDFLRRAFAFFGERERRFGLWVRDVAEDSALALAAESAGMDEVYSMPEMTLDRPTGEPRLPEGVTLRRVSDAAGAADYWRVAGASYASLGFPPQAFEHYDDPDGMLAEDVAAFVAYEGGEPLAIAMTIVSHGVAGVYWVGTLERARGRGLGGALTAAATNAGFAMGAEVASLQASPMGRPLYAAMGFRPRHDYRLLTLPEDAVPSRGAGARPR